MFVHPIPSPSPTLPTSPTAIDKPPSVWGTVQLMLQQEGPGVFFTGSLLRAAFYSPGTCIFFSVYETVAAALK